MKKYRSYAFELKDYFDAVDDLIHVVDRDMKVVYFNKALNDWLKEMGKEKNIIGKEIDQVFPFLPEEVVSEFRNVFKSRKVFISEIALNFNGREKITNTRRIPVIKDNEVVYVITMIRDITDQKKAEKEKANLEAQLLQAQKMEAIGQLAGGVAHDFNNILTTIIGYSNILQTKLEKDSPLRVYIDQILSSAQRAAQVTSSLLAFSRKQVIELRPHRINSIIRSVEGLLRRLLTEDIELVIELPDVDSMVLTDITQMEQVLINMATNARDAMPHGGALTIKVEPAEMDHAFLAQYGYGDSGQYVRICITDTGIGMDEKTREKIFDPFFTTKEIGKGTGLGLSIVYGIIKQHNGYINVMSESGHGTTFHIYLPVVKAKASKPKQPALFTRGGDEAILIAEDDREVRTLLKNILVNAGYTVIEARNGEDALSQFRKHMEEIRLLIADVVMPKLNGKEVYNKIKKMKPTKVLFISGYTADVVLDKGVYGKAFNYMSKPVSPDELLKKVREVLDGK